MTRAPIDHSKIIDGFGELQGRSWYEPFETRCAGCRKPIVFEGADQKYVHEVRGVPIKMARRVARCGECARARGRVNRAKAELVELRRAVERARVASKARPRDVGAGLAYLQAHLALLERVPNPRSLTKLRMEAGRVANLDPSRPDASYFLGVIWQRLGEGSRARHAFERASRGRGELARAAREALCDAS